MNLRTLFDKSKNNKIKIWKIETKENVIVMYHGYENGKITKTERTIFQGKNIGRSNETTPITQAEAEALSKWQKKIDKGWVQKKSLLGTKASYYPMLAKTYYHVNSPDVLAKKKKVTPLPTNVILQPKLNGVRCIAVKKSNCVKLYSRNMKDLTSVNYSLAQELNNVMLRDDIWDGEIYKHNWSFQRIISAIKKERLDTHSLEFWRYDVPSLSNKTMSQRFLFMSIGLINNKRIKQLNGTILHNPNHKDIKAQHDSWVKSGYEGIIIRDADAKYLWKHRGKELLKYKEFIDEEFRIIGYKSGHGNDEGAICFKCRIEPPEWRLGYRSYKYFDARPIGTIQDRRAMYKKGWCYVGRMLTVRYQERSVDRVPIFPVGTGIRDYE